MEPRGDSDNLLTFRPASSNYIGIVLGYRWLAGTVSFAIPASREIRAVEGESRYRDYRLSYYLNKFGAEASYTRYVGYLVEESEKLSAATLGGQPFYKIPDMETLGYGLNFVYVPSPGDYSLPAALDQSEMQDVSGGAWLLFGTWRYQKRQSDFPWVPAELRSRFGADQEIRYAKTDVYALGGGYGYNWIVTDAFFLSGLLSLTFGYEDIHYVAGAGEEQHSAFAANSHFRIVTGVNVSEFIFTLGGYLDYFSQTTSSVRIGDHVRGAVLAAIVRF
jgi:hypothetical protein